jgi:hypothetical protein
MQITKIKEQWGVRIDSSIEELLSTDIDFLRNLAYEKHFILLKGLGKISEQNIYKLVSRFGRPWEKEEYQYSTEGSFDVTFPNGNMGVLSKFSNAGRLKNTAMPWHADIPLWKGKEFPWRCLYNIQNDNPSPVEGITEWMSVMLDHIAPSSEELEYYSRIKILNQSWHGHTNENYLNNFIKKDPVTNKESLCANYFMSPGWGDKAWIKETYIDDVKVDNLEILGKIYKNLSMRDELVYKHQWSQYDCIIYNNWSFVHKRSALGLSPDQDRVFVRANMAHLSNEEWDRFKIN